MWSRIIGVRVVEILVLGSTGKKQRLFFALWPDDEQRQRLSASLSRVQPGRSIARPTPVANLHVTLIFLGAMDKMLRHCIEQAADRVVAPSFDLMLDRIVYQPRLRMLWAMPTETPAGLKMLVAGLESELGICGIEFDRRPYHAHMTLARKLSHDPGNAAFEPVSWGLTRFSLMLSEPQPAGVCYRELKSWSLK